MTIDGALAVVLLALLGFLVVMAGACAGALRALEVYHAPGGDSVVLSSDHDPPAER